MGKQEHCIRIVQKMLTCELHRASMSMFCLFVVQLHFHHKYAVLRTITDGKYVTYGQTTTTQIHNKTMKQYNKPRKSCALFGLDFLETIPSPRLGFLITSDTHIAHSFRFGRVRHTTHVVPEIAVFTFDPHNCFLRDLSAGGSVIPHSTQWSVSRLSPPEAVSVPLLKCLTFERNVRCRVVAGLPRCLTARGNVNCTDVAACTASVDS